MSEPLIEATSQRLRRAEAEGIPIPPLDELSPGDVGLAYAVQAASVRAWHAAGRTVAGHKIGLTNPKVQAQLGVDRPDFGVLFDDMRVSSGATVPYRRVLQPRIEAELAFVLGADLSDPLVGLDDVAAAVQKVHASLEIVGSRVRDWAITIVDTVADNGSAGAFVLGDTTVELDAVDLTGARMVLHRSRRGIVEVVSAGTAADCLGSPLIAAHWLAGELARRGDPLRAGNVLLTGALGPMVPVEPGDRFEASIEGVGAVAVAFGPE